MKTKNCMCGAGVSDGHYLRHDRHCPWPCYAEFNRKWAMEWQKRAEQAEIDAEVASFENQLDQIS